MVGAREATRASVARARAFPGALLGPWHPLSPREWPCRPWIPHRTCIPRDAVLCLQGAQTRGPGCTTLA